jgi:hypothetical protein
MLATAARHEGSAALVLTAYNRESSTFFSYKDLNVFNKLAQCISPLISQACNRAKMSEKHQVTVTTCKRGESLAQFIAEALNSDIFAELEKFCEAQEPRISHRVVLYAQSRLVKLPGNEQVAPDPQLLDAIVSRSVTVATQFGQAVIVFPIVVSVNLQCFLLFEFRADLLKLRTAEEKSGMLQRARLSQALERSAWTIPSHIERNYSDCEDRRPGFARRRSSSSGSSGVIETKVTIQRHNSGFSMPITQLSRRISRSESGSDTSLFQFGDLNASNASLDSFVVLDDKEELSVALDEESLQVFPFDSGLRIILHAFCKSSSRYLLLDKQRHFLEGYRPISRALHLIGNSMACPFVFSKLLRVLMASFTICFGSEVKIKIFDPPLAKPLDVDPTVLRLERNRLTYAILRMNNPLSSEKSAAVSCFADLITVLLTRRSTVGAVDEIRLAKIEPQSDGFDFDVSLLTAPEIVSVVIELFERFHISEVLNCPRDRVLRWIQGIVVRAEHPCLFMMMANTMHVCLSLMVNGGWMDSFTPIELACLGVYAFALVCGKQKSPRFRYCNAIAKSIESVDKIDQEAFEKMVSCVILLGDEQCDLLDDVDECVLIRFMEGLMSLGKAKEFSIDHFHAVRPRLDLSKGIHREVVRRFVVWACNYSMFFSPLSVFGEWALTMSMEGLYSIYSRLHGKVERVARELIEHSSQFKGIDELVRERMEWLKTNQGRAVVSEIGVIDESSGVFQLVNSF